MVVLDTFRKIEFKLTQLSVWVPHFTHSNSGPQNLVLDNFGLELSKKNATFNDFGHV